MGGTFMSMPEDYRNKFIAQLHNALSGHTTVDVDEAVRFSEQSKSKAIGITIETRPDYCLRPHLRYARPRLCGYYGLPLSQAKCCGMVARDSKLAYNQFMKTLLATPTAATPFAPCRRVSILPRMQASRSLPT